MKHYTNGNYYVGSPEKFEFKINEKNTLKESVGN